MESGPDASVVLSGQCRQKSTGLIKGVSVGQRREARV